MTALLLFMLIVSVVRSLAVCRGVGRGLGRCDFVARL